MKRVLFTSPVIGYPAIGGSELRIENTIRALCKLAEVHLVPRVSHASMGGKEADAFYRSIVGKLYFAPSTQSSLWARMRSKLDTYCGSSFVLKADCCFLQRYLEDHNIQILWCGYGNISYALISNMRKYMPKLKIVCDTDSVWSRFVLRELDVEDDSSKRSIIELKGHAKQHEEEILTNICDVTTAVSEVDAEYYRSISQSQDRIHICSNVINLDSYKVKYNPPLDFKTPAIFLGGSYYSPDSPMVRAAEWVCKHVMPIVWKCVPEAHLYLVGSGSDIYCADFAGPHVTVTGKVPSVLPVLQNSICSIVPLQFESGTRFKILESGACSIPIVSTTLGAEGIPVTHNKDILIADNPSDFACSIISLINNSELCRKLADNCHRLVVNKYTISSLSSEISTILDYLEA